MIKIAVVGDIGSGKSYLAKQFGFPEVLVGFPTFCVGIVGKLLGAFGAF